MSVNPAAREARLTYLKAPALVPLWQLDPARAAKARSEINPAELSRASILQQHWWWWLLLCGLAAFLGESAWLAARREQS